VFFAGVGKVPGLFRCEFFFGWFYSIRGYTVIKERPIPFTTLMVKAILDHRKSFTRRVIKPQALSYANDMLGQPCVYPILREGDFPEPTQIFCPYGVPGDRLWVRETFFDNSVDGNDRWSIRWIYRADGEFHQQFHNYDGLAKWRSSRYMPRAASRISLEIVSVHIERLHDITDDDAIAEGVERIDNGAWRDYFAREIGLNLGLKRGPKVNDYGCGSAVLSFRSLWQSINAKREFPWESNPWVWVVEFKKH